MKPRHVIAIALAITALGVVAWAVVHRTTAPGPPRRAGTAPPHASAPRPPTTPGYVTISGTVIDRLGGSPQAGLRVVLRGRDGEHVATSTSVGTYTLTVPAGRYRAFVRDDRFMTVEPAHPPRLRDGFARALVGASDEALLPRLDARASLVGIDLLVVRAASLSGTVVDDNGSVVSHAIVRTVPVDPLHAQLSGVLGTERGETDASGAFALRVPPGRYRLEASAPGYTSNGLGERITVGAGTRASFTVRVVHGCEISGRVMRPDGRAANGGALERDDGMGFAFAGVGQVAPDGTFQWTAMPDSQIALRAWPWQAAPSESHDFACRHHERFTNVVFHLPVAVPDLGGTIVDAAGAPVPLAYVDIKALEPGGINQQERADAAGSWQVFALPRGRYQVTATAPGRGIAVASLVAPSDGNDALQLGGTGRIVGTIPGLARGSVETRFESCSDALDTAQQPLALAPEPRIVPVIGGRFEIDDAPACQLALAVRWRQIERRLEVTVHPGTTTHVELAVGPPRAKLVRGVVRDPQGAPISDVRVTAALGHQLAKVVRTDPDGRFEIRTYAGAVLDARNGSRGATVTVGTANLPAERIDLVLRRDAP